jgi:transposase
MRAISNDLRQRAVNLYHRLGSYAEVARRLCVRQRWVSDMVRRQKEHGSLEPDYEKCGNKPKLDSTHEQRIRGWLQEENGLTLAEIQVRLVAEGVDVCPATVANTLERMRITRKKRPRLPKSATVPTSRKSATAGSRKR